MPQVQSSIDFAEVPSGVYAATLTRTIFKTLKSQFGENPSILWIYTINRQQVRDNAAPSGRAWVDAGPNMSVSAITGQSYGNKRANLTKHVLDLCGGDATIAAAWQEADSNTDRFLGAQVVLSVETKQDELPRITRLNPSAAWLHKWEKSGMTGDPILIERQNTATSDRKDYISDPLFGDDGDFDDPFNEV